MKSRFEIDNYPIYRFVMPEIESNMYISIIEDAALVVDPHVSEEALSFLKKSNIKKAYLILTHEHCDHISGVNVFRKEFECVVYGNKQCAERVKNPTKNMAAFFMAIFIDRDEETQKRAASLIAQDYTCEVDLSFENEFDLDIKDVHLHMIDTPGHSPGSICIVVNEKYIFSGDTIIPGEDIILRFVDGSESMWIEKTKPFVESLPNEMVVFPGHKEEMILGDCRNLCIDK